MLISISYINFNANAVPGRFYGYQRHFDMTKWQKCHTSDISRTDKTVILLSLCHMTDIPHISVGSNHL